MSECKHVWAIYDNIECRLCGATLRQKNAEAMLNEHAALQESADILDAMRESVFANLRERQEDETYCCIHKYLAENPILTAEEQA